MKKSFSFKDEKDLVTRKLKSKLEEKNESLNKTDGQTNVSFDFKQKFIETQNLAIVISYLTISTL